MSKKQAVSLNPENFIEGGGLIDDVDVVLEENRFEMFDYQGKANPTPCLKITMECEDIDDPMEQYYSMGSANDWIPSEDGTQLVAVGKATNIRLSSNGGIFLKALIDAGYPAEDLGDDISTLDGLQAHVIQIPAPKRGMKKSKEQEEREERFGPPTILVVSEIVALPGEKKKPKGAPKKAAGKKATGKGKAASKKKEDSGDLNEKALTAVMDILLEAGTITKKELPAKIFQTMKEDPDRNAMVKIVFDDAFLESGPWDYADGVLVSG
ncbi:hypothetical protein KAR91_42385 [Candidatus Pacearchaeota archaeon]|nr:hypothetical protein [Candidatus Pacearchaeota archaeon]